MKKYLLIAALVLPIGWLMLWALQLESNWRGGAEVRIAIQGYDPRDLLSGHYLRYQIGLGDVKACAITDAYNQEVCVCLAPKAGGDGKWFEAIEGGSCSSISRSCPVVMKGSCMYSRATFNVEQYYIPEELAPVLAVVPPNSSAILSVSPSGTAQVKALMVGEQSIEEYARAAIQKAAESLAATPTPDR